MNNWGFIIAVWLVIIACVLLSGGVLVMSYNIGRLSPDAIAALTGVGIMAFMVAVVAVAIGASFAAAAGLTLNNRRSDAQIERARIHELDRGQQTVRMIRAARPQQRRPRRRAMPDPQYVEYLPAGDDYDDEDSDWQPRDGWYERSR